MANLDGRIVFANKRAEEILGLTVDKMTGLTYDSPDVADHRLRWESIPHVRSCLLHR